MCIKCCISTVVLREYYQQTSGEQARDTSERGSGVNELLLLIAGQFTVGVQSKSGPGSFILCVCLFFCSL